MRSSHSSLVIALFHAAITAATAYQFVQHGLSSSTLNWMLLSNGVVFGYLMADWRYWRRIESSKKETPR